MVNPDGADLVNSMIRSEEYLEQTMAIASDYPSIPYPDGWTVDDYWPNAPKISPYIVDGNIVSVNFSISKNGKGVEIFQNNDYRFSFINELEIGAVTNITPSLNYGETSGIVSLAGTVSKDIVKDFPVLDTARFFTVKTKKSIG